MDSEGIRIRFDFTFYLWIWSVYAKFPPVIVSGKSDVSSESFSSRTKLLLTSVLQDFKQLRQTQSQRIRSSEHLISGVIR